MEKQRWEESEKRTAREEKKREDQRRERVGRVAILLVFPTICGSGGSKSRLAKAAGAEPSGEKRDEQLHVFVARSTYPSENVQSTPFSDHFWKLRCRKSARHCGAKHISKSKVLETDGSDSFGCSDVNSKWQAQGTVHLVKSEQNVRVLWHLQKQWQCATFEEDLQRCILPRDISDGQGGG